MDLSSEPFPREARGPLPKGMTVNLFSKPLPLPGEVTAKRFP